MLSTHQHAALDFRNASLYLREIADDGKGRGLLDFTDAFIQGVNAFGQCGLNARREERLHITGLRKGETTAGKRATEENEKGLRALGVAREALGRFREELASYPGDVDISADADRTMGEIRGQLAELEAKPSDLKKLDKAIAEGFENAQRGPGELSDYLEDRLKRLEEARRRPDRGEVDNIPVWKIAAIVVAVGIWIWALFRCTWWGSCSLREGLSYATIFWIAALIARYD